MPAAPLAFKRFATNFLSVIALRGEGRGAAADPGSAEADITTQLADFHVTVPRVPLSAKGLLLTEGRNQMPTTLVFKNGVLIDRRLGAQSFERLREWVGGIAGVN